MNPPNPAGPVFPGGPDEPCPACDGAADFAVHRAGRDFRRCAACGLLFVPRAQHPRPDRERERYLLHDNTAENQGYMEFLERVIEAMRAHCPDARQVLDYGCGPTGALVKLLREAGCDAQGYDLYFTPGGLPAGPFDTVLSVETFEHFRNPKAEMARIAGILKPGGRLLVQTALSDGRTDLDTWWYLEDFTHVCIWSREALARLGRAHGFEPAYSDGKAITVLRGNR